MPQPLTRADLLSLEAYASERAAFRRRVIAHKKPRQVQLGDHLRLLFEDRLTIHYQIQEMLRAERIFEAAGIDDELAAYNPLIPDGDNWKATMLIEYPDVDERRAALARLVGVEDRVWARVGDGERLFAIADEDLERSTADKTSSVHFLRFQLTPAMVAAARAGAAIAFGVDHPGLSATQDPVPDATRTALAADLH